MAYFVSFCKFNYGNFSDPKIWGFCYFHDAKSKKSSAEPNQRQLGCGTAIQLEIGQNQNLPKIFCKFCPKFGLKFWGKILVGQINKILEYAKTQNFDQNFGQNFVWSNWQNFGCRQNPKFRPKFWAKFCLVHFADLY